MRPALILPALTLTALAVLAPAAAAQARDVEAPSADAADIANPAPDRTADADAPPANPDSLTIGGGVALLPSYDGSDDYIVRPVGALRAHVAGIDIATRGTQVTADLIDDAPGARWKFRLGPAFNLNLNRTGNLVDRRVDALRKRHVALEIGGSFGVSRTGIVTSKYDTLSLRVNVLRDVTGVHDSVVVAPSIDYGTPLSRHFYIGMSLGASFVDDRYARTYFAVSPAGSARSGLPVFANPKGGLKSWSLTGIATRSITGDLRHGLGVYVAVSYSRLNGDFARSPIVAIAGSPDQLLTAIGLGYTF